MNSNDCSQTPPNQPSVVILEVKGRGHIPSFKTQKSAAINRRTGKPFPVTSHKIKKWMNETIRSFELQLSSAIQARQQDQIPTAPPRLFWIASCAPLDDSRKWIRELHILCRDVPLGGEGATILIERIPAAAIQPQ